MGCGDLKLTPDLQQGATRTPIGHGTAVCAQPATSNTSITLQRGFALSCSPQNHRQPSRPFLHPLHTPLYEGAYLHATCEARVCLNSMDSDSPLSAPGTPRTISPSPFDDNLVSTPSPSQDDARTATTQADADGDWESVSGAGATSASSTTPASREPATKPVKGKEKARKGPLRLLDLPVDILKEIIHQVSSRLVGNRHLRTRRPEYRLTYRTAPPHE